MIERLGAWLRRKAPDPSRPGAPVPSRAPGHPRAEARGRYYLEFRAGTSAKGYAILHLAHDDGSESVLFAFGRIGHLRAWQPKVSAVGAETAAATVRDLLAEKRSKGYHDADWPADLAEPAMGPVATIPFVSAIVAALPPAGAPTVGGIVLPPGAPVAPGMADGDDDPMPTLWMTGDKVPRVGEMWIRLAEAFPDTGLWPLIVETPELDDVLAGPSAPSRRSARAVLERAWAESELGDADAPGQGGGRRFPGLAPSPGAPPDTSAYPRLARELSGWLGLVPVERPADVVRAIGWLGWANYDLDPADMAVVYRSWEERFGAVLIGLGFDVLRFGVARPPVGRREAAGVAFEQFASCPDLVWQGTDTLGNLADHLSGEKAWAFWWD